MLAKEEKNKPLELWPTNFGNEYKGLVSLRTALKESLNVSAVKLIKEVGVEATIKTAEEMGITTLQPADRYSDRLSLALGGLNKGVTPGDGCRLRYFANRVSGLNLMHHQGTGLK